MSVLGHPARTGQVWNRALVVVLGLAPGLAPRTAGAATEPAFATYPAEARSPTPPAAAVLDTPLKRRFRTVLKDEAREPADFNGRYRIARWGCGSGCLSWAVVDQKTGAVWMAPKPLSACFRTTPEADPNAVPDWFDYRIDSSLLLAYDCDRQDGTATFNLRRVYVWQQGQPKLLRTERVSY